MARAREAELAALTVEDRARHGDEHAHVVALGQPRVELLQDVGRARRRRGRSRAEPRHARHQERGGHSLVRDVADREDQPLAVQQEEVVEIAADLAGRLERCGDPIAAGQRLGRRRRAASTAGSAGRSRARGPAVPLRRGGRPGPRCAAEACAACGRSCRRSALTSKGFQIAGSRVSRSPPPMRSTDRVSVSSGREMRRADSQTRHEREAEDAEPDQDLPLRQAARLGHELSARRGQEQEQRLAGVHVDAPLDPDPVAARERQGDVAPHRRASGAARSRPRTDSVEIREPGEAGLARRPGPDEPGRVRVGDQQPEAIDEREPGGEGHRGTRRGAARASGA